MIKREVQVSETLLCFPQASGTVGFHLFNCKPMAAIYRV